MSESRLSLALDRGLFDIPEGRIGVWGARGDSDLAPLPPDRTVAVTGFRPDVERLEARGVHVGGPEECALAIVMLPRSRDLARAAIAAAAACCRGPVVVDGQKSDGIEAILRDLRARGDVSEALSKGHGKIAVLAPGADLADWRDPGPREVEGGFVTRVGVFSADGPDPGSVALAAALPEKLPPRVADLGAGWGYLSRAVLAREGVEEVHLIEADRAALDCARANLPDPRARFHWVDALTLTPDALGGSVDAIVANPPFHTSRAADPGLGRGFIAAASRLLKPSGTLWLVANRHLPYEGTLREAFREVADIGPGSGPYKLVRATRPVSSDREKAMRRRR